MTNWWPSRPSLSADADHHRPNLAGNPAAEHTAAGNPAAEHTVIGNPGAGANMACPCGRDRRYAQCCELVHRNDAGLGAAAEDLMRARYSAFVLNNVGFLIQSWHPDTRPAELSLESDREWRGLTVVETARGTGLDQDGVVQFIARFNRGGDNFELHERSSFTRVGGKWRYVDGVDPRR